MDILRRLENDGIAPTNELITKELDSIYKAHKQVKETIIDTLPAFIENFIEICDRKPLTIKGYKQTLRELKDYSILKNKRLRFDEINYKGFHFYDLDISLQVYMLGLKSLCVYDILIEHISNSKLDNEWLTNARIFFTKWKNCLPIVSYPVSAKERRVLEKNNLQTMNYIINENNRKPSHYYKFSEKLYLLRYCCDKKMLQSLIY